MKLLPHYVNIAAICWLILWAIVRSTLPFFLPQPPEWPLWTIILNVIALGLACFSAEKVEDEMINQLRLKSIAFTAGLYLLIHISWFFLSLTSLPEMLIDFFKMLSEDADIWFFLYLIILKIRIFAVGRRMAND
jgi:hypothetical protein